MRRMGCWAQPPSSGGFDGGRDGLRGGRRLSFGGRSSGIGLAWCPDAGATAPGGGSDRVELGGGSAGGGSGPWRLVSFVASDHRARGAGGLCAGLQRRTGWSSRAGVWFETHHRAKALSWLVAGTDGGDALWRRVLLEGACRGGALASTPGFLRGKPQILRGIGRGRLCAAYLLGPRLGCSAGQRDKWSELVVGGGVQLVCLGFGDQAGATSGLVSPW